MLDNSLSEREVASLPRHLFPSEELHKLSNRYLAMQLYRSCQYVLGCQEAMWEELKDRLRNRREELSPYGWDDDDELEELQSRTKFEKLIERFKTYVPFPSVLTKDLAVNLGTCTSGSPFGIH